MRERTATLPILALIAGGLVVFMASYMGAYYALLTGGHGVASSYSWRPEVDYSIEPEYRIEGVAPVLKPAFEVDLRLRPGYWESTTGVVLTLENIKTVTVHRRAKQPFFDPPARMRK